LHVYATPGPYNINLTVTNGNGTGSITGTITVSSGAQVPEFPSIALPVAAVLCLVAIFGRNKKLEK